MGETQWAGRFVFKLCYLFCFTQEIWPATPYLKQTDKKQSNQKNPAPNPHITNKNLKNTHIHAWFSFNVKKRRNGRIFFFKHSEDKRDFILSVYLLFWKLGTIHVKILTRSPAPVSNCSAQLPKDQVLQGCCKNSSLRKVSPTEWQNSTITAFWKGCDTFFWATAFLSYKWTEGSG